MSINQPHTLAERIRALPEPYQTNLVEWFICGLDWPIHAPCDGLVDLNDLLRAAPLIFLVQLSAVLKEVELHFGTLLPVTLQPLEQTICASV